MFGFLWNKKDNMQESETSDDKKFIGKSGKFYTAVEKWINKMPENNRGENMKVGLWIIEEYLHNI